ncbi:MAG: ABC transporter permease subunit [Candidatus Poribacteria bacterium]|nr:ABC transporter permease subunit [Candidatus Poribacteria bacterium]
MFLTLIRRELLDNLMTFRFAAAVVIMLLLVVANTVVLIKDYEGRLADYNSAVKTHRQELRLENKTYSDGMLSFWGTIIVDRPPNPLSIFNTGLDKRLGNEIRVSHIFTPTIWDANKHEANNPYFNILTSIDIVLIFQGILSLLALTFAYDAIAGEYEHGTLRLVLSHPVRRGYILFAKYIGAIVCLFVPLLMSLLLMLILLTTSATVSLSSDDFLRIGGIVLTSLVYLSLFYLIGMLISAITRRTSTALILSMFVWGFLVLVYPNLILTAVDTAPQADPEPAAYHQIKRIWEELERKRDQFFRNDPVPGESWGFNLEGTGASFSQSRDKPSRLLYYTYVGSEFEKIDEKSEPYVPHAQNFYGFIGPLTVNTVERTWRIRKPALETIYVEPANRGRMLLKFSPAGLYDAATEAWAGTDLNGIQDFFTAAQRHRQAVVNHFYDEKIFASRQWFSSDQGAVDWDTLPQFSFQRSDIGTNAKRALPDLFLLFTMNIFLFIAIFLVFIKSEV